VSKNFPLIVRTYIRQFIGGAGGAIGDASYADPHAGTNAADAAHACPIAGLPMVAQPIPVFRLQSIDCLRSRRHWRR